MMAERGSGDDARRRFARDAAGRRWSYAGALTFANAGAVFAAAAAVPLPTDGEVDLAGMAVVDSAAVAVLLALRRRAGAESKPLRFVNVPSALLSLAALYGVEEIVAA
jgi:phospholipid transport system transporter-binding protein